MNPEKALPPPTRTLFTPTALAMFGAFPFASGNVRELKAGIENLLTAVREDTWEDESNVNIKIAPEYIRRCFAHEIKENRQRIPQIQKEIDACEKKRGNLPASSLKEIELDASHLLQIEIEDLNQKLKDCQKRDFSKEGIPAPDMTYAAYCFLKKEESVEGYLYFTDYDINGAAEKFKEKEKTLRNKHPKKKFKEDYPYTFYVDKRLRPPQNAITIRDSNKPAPAPPHDDSNNGGVSESL